MLGKDICRGCVQALERHVFLNKHAHEILKREKKVCKVNIATNERGVVFS